MSDIMLNIFFHMNLNIKLYHWQTKSYARHKGSDALWDELNELADKFVEVYLGKYDTLDFKDDYISVKNITDDMIVEVLNNYINYLKKDISKILKSSDTDLLNIRDEMLEVLNKTLYLFTLN